MRRISGGRITATGRKTNGMKYATKAEGPWEDRISGFFPIRSPKLHHVTIGWLGF